jgi:hypothetical protein
MDAINYWAIITGGILSMILGAIWYGPLFGKQWMKIVQMNPNDKEKMKEVQKGAMPLYFVQFILILFQVLVLAHLIADTQLLGGLERALWIWAAFVIPTLAGAIMWDVKTKALKWSKFLIQAGYQLLMFAIYGLLLLYWI